MAKLSGSLSGTPKGNDGKNPDKTIVLFDGVCNTCNSFVDFILRHDPKDQFRFASLQEAPKIPELAALAIPAVQSMQTSYESVVAIRGTKIWTRSLAVFEILRVLGGPWALLAWARYLPTPLTDAAYGLFARHRYRWFGKRSTCRLPLPHEQKKFLK